jgi:hypothetical protein
LQEALSLRGEPVDALLQLEVPLPRQGLLRGPSFFQLGFSPRAMLVASENAKFVGCQVSAHEGTWGRISAVSAAELNQYREFRGK